MSIRHEVSEARVALTLDRNVGVLGYLDDLSVENVQRIIGAADPDKRSLAVGAARVRDVTKPSAVLTEHPHRVKIQAAMEHGTYTEPIRVSDGRQPPLASDSSLS